MLLIPHSRNTKTATALSEWSSCGCRIAEQLRKAASDGQSISRISPRAFASRFTLDADRPREQCGGLAASIEDVQTAKISLDAGLEAERLGVLLRMGHGSGRQQKSDGYNGCRGNLPDRSMGSRQNRHRFPPCAAQNVSPEAPPFWSSDAWDTLPSGHVPGRWS